MIWIDASLAEGIPDPGFETLAALPHQVFREVESRSTRRVEIDGRVLFVKLHRGVGWRQILSDLVRLRWPVVDAGNEVRALARLQAAGLRCPRVLAWGRRGWNPAQRRSFVVLESLEDHASCEELVAAGLDAAQRLYSSRAAGLSRRDQLRFVIAYARSAETDLRRDASLWRQVRQRAARIAARERRLGRRDTALLP